MCESLSSLGQTEEWFWQTEPRIVFSLVEQKRKLKQIEQKNLAAYIACCVWGKDPSEIDGTNIDEKVPGRDIPVDPALLRGFYG